MRRRRWIRHRVRRPAEPGIDTSTSSSPLFGQSSPMSASTDAYSTANLRIHVGPSEVSTTSSGTGAARLAGPSSVTPMAAEGASGSAASQSDLGRGTALHTQGGDESGRADAGEAVHELERGQAGAEHPVQQVGRLCGVAASQGTQQRWGRCVTLCCKASHRFAGCSVSNLPWAVSLQHTWSMSNLSCLVLLLCHVMCGYVQQAGVLHIC